MPNIGHPACLPAGEMSSTAPVASRRRRNRPGGGIALVGLPLDRGRPGGFG
jgi:hypothetical protein